MLKPKSKPRGEVEVRLQPGGGLTSFRTSKGLSFDTVFCFENRSRFCMSKPRFSKTSVYLSYNIIFQFQHDFEKTHRCPRRCCFFGSARSGAVEMRVLYGSSPRPARRCNPETDPFQSAVSLKKSTLCDDRLWRRGKTITHEKENREHMKRSKRVKETKRNAEKVLGSSPYVMKAYKR